jgi:hypothetical protein
MRRDVRILQRAIIKRVEVVDTDDLVAVGEQTVESVGADEACTACE